MKNTELKKLLADFFFGSISRKNLKKALSKLLEDDSFSNLFEKESIDRLSRLSLYNNTNYILINEFRSTYLRFWYGIVEDDSSFEETEGYDNPERTYLVANYRNHIFTNRDSYESDYSEVLRKIIDNYLNDGISELYFINLVNRISFTNNETGLNVFNFKDRELLSVIISIIDYDNGFSSFEVKPVWSLEKNLREFMSKSSS